MKNGNIIDEIKNILKNNNVQVGDLLYWDHNGEGVTHTTVISQVDYENGKIFFVLCIMIYIRVQIFVERQDHEEWIKQKEEEFESVIKLAYSVMRGEKRIETPPLSRYDISHYAGYQDACKIDVDIKELVDKLIEIRKQENISQSELAKMTGNTQQAISRLEKRIIVRHYKHFATYLMRWVVGL